MSKKDNSKTSDETLLLQQIVELIEKTKHQVAIQINSGVTLLFWQVGNHINNFILNNQRAEYGKQIVPTLSAQLVA